LVGIITYRKPFSSFPKTTSASGVKSLISCGHALAALLHFTEGKTAASNEAVFTSLVVVVSLAETCKAQTTTRLKLVKNDFIEAPLGNWVIWVETGLLRRRMPPKQHVLPECKPAKGPSDIKSAKPERLLQRNCSEEQNRPSDAH
jgi:hypothetical protein